MSSRRFAPRKIAPIGTKTGLSERIVPPDGTMRSKLVHHLFSVIPHTQLSGGSEAAIMSAIHATLTQHEAKAAILLTIVLARLKSGSSMRDDLTDPASSKTVEPLL